MPNSTKLTLTVIALTLAFSAPVFAQEKSSKMPSDVQVKDIFISADIDKDRALNRDEFISYVVMAAENGFADYATIKLSGDYDNHFNTKDYNADGLLTAEELKKSEMRYGEDDKQPKQDNPG